MARAGAISDLFGHVPQAGELPIAGSSGDAPNAVPSRNTAIVGGLLPPPPGGNTPDSMRKQIMYALDQARALETMTWPPWLVRRYTAGMIMWSEWLKGGEGDRLLAEFKAEMDRLNPPIDQLGVNWREHWGLD